MFKPTVLIIALVCFVAYSYGAGDQEHIARTNSYSEMTISWMTKKEIASATVEFFNVSKKIYSAVGESAVYFKDAGYVHHTLLKNLAQNTVYFYRCQGETKWTDWYQFVTPNVTWTGPYQIPVYGDMGTLNSANTIKSVADLIAADRDGKLSERIPFILHVGDISYADDRSSDEYEKIWNLWFDMVENITRYVPYMVMPGNHEHESGDPHLPYTQYFVDYNYRFKMPLSGSLDPYYNQPHSMFWSLDHQNIHFIAISTETDYINSPYTPKFGDQLTWLKNDLIKANANRAVTPWIIAMGHRPLYSSAAGHYIQDMLPPLQDAFEDLFHQYGVDLFLCGHVHAYERTWPVYKNKTTQYNYINPKGLVTLTAGAAGDIEGLSKDWITPSPEWSAVHYDKRETYGLLHVVSNTELKWELLVSQTNTVIDTFTLIKNKK